MKLFRIFLVLFIPTILLISSCSENSTDTPKTVVGNKYAPTVIGSWWTYTNYALDSLNNKISESEYQIKVALDTTVEKEGHNAYVLEYQKPDGTPSGIEDDFIYTTKTQIFKYFSIVPKSDFSLPIEIPIDWYKIADNDATKWTLATQTVEGIEMETNNGKVTLSGDITITVSNEGKENVKYGANLDKTVESMKFKITFAFDGTVKVAVVPIPIPFKFSVESENYYGEGIGLVKTSNLPLSISVTGIGEVYHANGSEQLLLDYHIPN